MGYRKVHAQKNSESRAQRRENERQMNKIKKQLVYSPDSFIPSLELCRFDDKTLEWAKTHSRTEIHQMVFNHFTTNKEFLSSDFNFEVWRTATSIYILSRWLKYQKPVYELDSTITFMLLNTVISDESWMQPLKLPYPCVYVSVPPTISFMVGEKSLPLKGFFIDEVEGRYLIKAFGRSEKGMAVQHFEFTVGQDPRSTLDPNTETVMLQCINIVFTFFPLLVGQHRQIEVKEVKQEILQKEQKKRVVSLITPPNYMAPIPIRKVSLVAHTIKEQEMLNDVEKQISNTETFKKRAQVRAHIVPGHYSYYWMKEGNVPEGTQILATRTSAQGLTKVLVEKWIWPYFRGPKDKAMQPITRVTENPFWF